MQLITRSLSIKTIGWMVLLLCLLAAVVLTISFDFNGVTKNAAQRHTFLSQFVIAGGPIVWFILVPMSLYAGYLAALYTLSIRREKLLTAGITDLIIDHLRKTGLGGLTKKIADKRDFVSVAVCEALNKSTGDWFRMRSVIAESLQDQALNLLRKLEWINLIGNIAPMVGLFGTVVGMIQLFDALVAAGGQPQPAQLAGGISVALVTTFWGLLIAIPALSIHGFFRNRVETLINEAVVESEKVMPEIKRSLDKLKKMEILKKQSISKTDSADDKNRQKDLCP